MPRGDGTGPRGMGAGTGRGLGGCRMRGTGPVGGTGGLPDDRPGYRQANMDADPNPAHRPVGCGSGIVLSVRDALFAWLERVTRSQR
jgi:hypothetical protein